MESSPPPSDKHERQGESAENRDLKRIKITHDGTSSRQGTHGPASSDGHRSPAPSTSRATSVGSPEKPRGDSGSLAKSVVKKNAKPKKAPDSGSRKAVKRSASKDEETVHDAEANDDEDGNENENVYCVCKGQEEGTMVGCEVCDNWFHPKCVGIDEEKVDLLDVYICEACEPLTSQRTRYKRFCKREGCGRQAAPSSKYCSSRCALQVAQVLASGLDEKTASEVRRNLTGYPTPAPSVSTRLADGSHPREEIASRDALLAGLKSQLSVLERQMELVNKRQTLLSQAIESWEALPLVLVEVPARRKGKSKRREMETVEVRPCGWDSRLIWDDAAIEKWDESRGEGPLCDGGKRCDRHQGWQKTVAAALDVEGAVINRRKQDMEASIERAERYVEAAELGRRARTEVHQALAVKTK